MSRHRVAEDYRRKWLRERSRPTCPRWADPVAFVADVGERPPGCSLSKTAKGPASCGSCEACLAGGTPRNVAWTTGRGSAAAVLYRGALVSRAEVGRREGVSRQAVGYRVLMGLPLEGMGGGVAPSSTA